MKRFVKPLVAAAALAIPLWAASCATIDPNASKASAGTPAAAQVEVINLPYDASLPRFVVAIEPFTYLAQGSNVTSGNSMETAPEEQSSYSVSTVFVPGGPRDRGPGGRGGGGPGGRGGGPGGRGGGPGGRGGGPGGHGGGGPGGHGGHGGGPGGPFVTGVSVSSGLTDSGSEATSTHEEPTGYGPAVSAQFTTALTHWPNVSVVDWSAVQVNGDGTYSTRLNPGEVGPFIVSGNLTEFNETAQAAGGNFSVSGGTVGAVMAAFGVRGGAELAAVNPEYKSKKEVRQGMVGLDLTLKDGRTGRIVRGYNCTGTFTTQSAVNGMSVAGIGGGNSQFAASALGQATRVAMNDAVKQTADALRVAPR